MEVTMNAFVDRINDIVMYYFPLILLAFGILNAIFFYLIFRKKKQEETAVKIETSPVDIASIRLHTHILNSIRNLTTDSKELGFTYENDYIQALLADVPKVIAYYREHFNELHEDIVSVLPCIPENLVPSNQLMATTFMQGKYNLPSERMRNAVEIPKKPYWLFLVTLQKVDPKNMFLDRGRSGLTTNELIRTATHFEETWRSRSNQLISNGSLLDGIIPIVFRYDLSRDVPELCAYSEKVSARDYYLVTCMSRVCFSE